ncbi:MAG: class I SAM-dependent methyltransferase [Proteobacteria bacterium]|nr:class I SAM-dependent methyltransferase [Pseudomonadota bacterium]
MTASPRHTYEYDIDLDSDVAPARVIRMVGNGKKVLEVGAGPGSITKHLSGTLGCDVVAVEIDQSALQRLTPFARKVYPLDLNNSSWSDVLKSKEGCFDVVIAADVLEHVYDPWSVLRGMKSLLNDTGSIVLSIPHVGHAAIAGCLFDEDFEYRPWGLLDRTHIRFFGIKNIQNLYNSEGLSIEQSEFVVRTPEMTEFAPRWRRLPDNLRQALQNNRFSHVYQVVSRAVPQERAKLNLRLMDADVPAPSDKTVEYWTETMKFVPSPEGEDTTSTLEKIQIVANS